jgi:hypothetical protein
LSIAGTAFQNNRDVMRAIVIRTRKRRHLLDITNKVALLVFGPTAAATLLVVAGYLTNDQAARSNWATTTARVQPP